MTPTGWDDRKQATRERVLAAAHRLIAANGPDGLTIRKLAAEADVAVGTIYNQFGDRSGVLAAMVQSGLATLADSIEHDRDDADAANQGPFWSTRKLIYEMLDGYEADEQVWRPVFAVLKAEPGDHGLGETGERMLNIARADIAAADKAGLLAIDMDHSMMASHLLDGQFSLLARWAFGMLTMSDFRERSTRTLELTIASVLKDPHRDTFLRRGLAG